MFSNRTQGVARFHQEAKQPVSIVFIRRRRKAGAGGRNGQHAQQIGIADSLAPVDHHPDIRGQVTVKRAVLTQSRRNLTQGLPGPHFTTSLNQKIAQLHDLFRVADRHSCQL
jgi:hypothetical protein